MKKLYYSTFVPGLEDAVSSLLRHEGGVTVERVMDGGVLYRSVREPDFAYMHHTFMVLTQLNNIKTLDDAVKRLMTQGEWLDRMPYETLDGKKFRIVTMNDGQLESVNMRYLNMLEKVIMDHTGMRTLREKPEVELWIDRHSQGGTLFLWRIGARRGVKAAAPGLLRSDLCAILASLCRVGGKNAVNLAARDSAIPYALFGAGAKNVSAVSENEKDASAVRRVSRVRMVEEAQDLDDRSAAAVIAHVPEKAPGGAPEKYLRELLTECGRIVTRDGVIVVVALRGQAENAMERTPGVEVRARYDIVISGKKTVVWMLRASEEDVG